MRRLLAILGLLALAAPLPAAPTASTTLYDIEVVVFENSQPGLEGGEVWKELRKELGDIEQAATPEGAPAPDSVLSQAAGALERGGQHRILVHKRWQQNADTKPATTPLRLQSANNELDGTLRFYLSRFLHVDLNLTLQDPRASGGVKAFQLNEHRRVRPQEIHYFDHPRLGALVRVTAVGKPEAPRPAKRVKPAQ